MMKRGWIIILVILGVMLMMHGKKEASGFADTQSLCESGRATRSSYPCVAPCVEITDSLRTCLRNTGLSNIDSSPPPQWYYYYNSGGSCQSVYDLDSTSRARMDCAYGGVPGGSNGDGGDDGVTPVVSHVTYTHIQASTANGYIDADLTLKNDGSATESFLVEVQAYDENKKQSSTSLAICDSNCKYNVHRIITIAAGATETYNFRIPISGYLPSGQYHVLAVSTDKCCSGNPSPACVAKGPFGWGVWITSMPLTITSSIPAITGDLCSTPFCGDGTCGASEDSLNCGASGQCNPCQDCGSCNCGSWGACVNNVQTRTCTSGTRCVLQQACTSPTTCLGTCKANACSSYSSCSSLAGSCTSGNCCSGTCGAASCVTHSSSACDSGDLYWYNSCGVKEDVKQDCSNGCSNGACTSTTASHNECVNDVCTSVTGAGTSTCNSVGSSCSVAQPTCSATNPCTGCNECQNGKCVSSCMPILQSCKNGKCEVSIMIYILGGFILLMVVMSSLPSSKGGRRR